MTVLVATCLLNEDANCATLSGSSSDDAGNISSAWDPSSSVNKVWVNFASGGGKAPNAYNHGFFKFDVSSIPAVAIVSSATANLQTMSDTTGSITVRPRRLTSAFTEGTGTRNTPTVDLGASGGTDTSTPSGSGTAFTVPISATVVQNWVNGSTTNYGIRLASQDASVGTKCGITARTTGFPPTLSVTYNQPPSQPGAFTVPVAAAVYTNLINVDWGDAAADPDGDAFTYRLYYRIGAGSQVLIADNIAASAYAWNCSAAPSSAAYQLDVYSKDTSGVLSLVRTSATFTISHNVAPTPATPVSPVGGAIVDRTLVQRFSWTFNDPDAGDTQLHFDFRYRVIGAGAWTTVSPANTANTFYDLAANTLVAGSNYEWQVLTYDALNTPASAFSASGLFTAASPPADPVLTAPAAGVPVIATAAYQATWTAAAQDAFQMQRVADAAGVIDPATVYEDSGTVVSTPQRDYLLNFSVNNRYEWVRMRVRVNTLWSNWVTRRVQVAYAAPGLPILVVTPDANNGRMIIAVDNPVPVGAEPAIAQNYVFRKVNGTTDDFWRRIKVGLANDGTYYDYAVASGVKYDYYVRAVGTTGAIRDSAVNLDHTVVLKGTWLHAVNNPAATAHQFKYNGAGGEDEWTPELTLSDFAGRVNQVAEYGEAELWSAAADLSLEGDAEVAAIRALAGLKTTLCYRDRSGRRVFGVLPSLRVVSAGWGGTTTVTVNAVDYTETV